MLLLPIGFGAILVNLPLKSIWEYERELDATVTKIINDFPSLQDFFTGELNYVVENGQALKVEPESCKYFSIRASLQKYSQC